MRSIALSYLATLCALHAGVGVGAQAIDGAEVVFDGSREMLDAKWTYWQGPRFSSSLPIKWKIVDDPVNEGTVVRTDDPAAKGGKYGSADIVTKKAYRDIRLHLEFNIAKPGGNSGIYTAAREVLWKAAWHHQWLERLAPDRRGGVSPPVFQVRARRRDDKLQRDATATFKKSPHKS